MRAACCSSIAELAETKACLKHNEQGAVVSDDYEEFRRSRQRRRSFATAELSDEMVQAIDASRMDERHAHLDSILEPK
jgi:hypothetical protein